MAWDLRSQREIENLLQAAQTAVLETAERGPNTSELRAFIAGVVAAFTVTAQGLGVKPPARVDSVIDAEWTVKRVERSDNGTIHGNL